MSATPLASAPASESSRRSRAAWTLLGIALAGVACSARIPVAEPPDTRAARPARAPVWARFVEARRWPPVTRPFTSEHLFEPRSAVVRVPPDMRGAYLQWIPGASLPDGAAVVEELSGRPAEAPALFLVMEKRAGQWAYLTLDAEGRPLSAPAVACQRCHVEAVSDELFGAASDAASPIQAPADADAPEPTPME